MEIVLCWVVLWSCSSFFYRSRCWGDIYRLCCIHNRSCCFLRSFDGCTSNNGRRRNDIWSCYIYCSSRRGGISWLNFFLTDSGWQVRKKQSRTFGVMKSSIWSRWFLKLWNPYPPCSRFPVYPQPVCRTVWLCTFIFFPEHSTHLPAKAMLSHPYRQVNLWNGDYCQFRWWNYDRRIHCSEFHCKASNTVWHISRQ